MRPGVSETKGIKVVHITVKGASFKRDLNGDWWREFKTDKPCVLLDQGNLPKEVEEYERIKI